MQQNGFDTNHATTLQHVKQVTCKIDKFGNNIKCCGIVYVKKHTLFDFSVHSAVILGFVAHIPHYFVISKKIMLHYLYIVLTSVCLN